MMQFKYCLIFLLCCLPFENVWASDQLTIAAIKNASTIQLSNDQILQLDGVWSSAPETVDYLKSRVGQFVMVNDLGRNRHGEIVADVSINNENLQSKMISDGMALAYPFAKSETQFAELLKLEQQARLAGQGLWRNKQFIIFQAMQKIPFNAFQIAEGTVASIVKGKGVIYINFGQDYRTDFTLFVTPKDLSRFRQSNFDLMALTGKAIRVRGWVYQKNGPAMDLTMPLQIEIL